MPPMANIEISENNGAAPVATLNAAPELNVNWNLKKLPSTRLGLGSSRRIASDFEKKSTRKTKNATATTRRIARMCGAESLSVVPLSVYKPCIGLPAGIPEVVPSQLPENTLRTGHKF